MIVPRHANVKKNRNTRNIRVFRLYLRDYRTSILPIIETMKRYTWLAFGTIWFVQTRRTLYPFPWTSLSRNNPTDILTKKIATKLKSACIQDHSIIREKFAASTGSAKMAEVWCPTPNLTSSTKQTRTPAAKTFTCEREFYQTIEK